MVVPHRPAVFTAKALATIDVLSQGRVTVGCGAGWMDEEFKAIGAPPFAERGKVTDEYLRAFKTLWTRGRSALRGSATCASQTSSFCPSRCKSRTRRSGSAARARRRCAAPSRSAMPGIRSARIRSFRWTRLSAIRRRIAALRDEASRARPRSGEHRALPTGLNWYKEGQQQHGRQRRATTLHRQRRRSGAAISRLPLARRASPAVQLRARHAGANRLAAMERFATKVLPLAGQ